MFVIKNVRPHDIKVGLATLIPNEQIRCEILNDAINDAADRGDITVTDATPTQAELKSDADAIMDGVDKMRHIAED